MATDAAFLTFGAPLVVAVAFLLLYAWRLGRRDKALNGAYAALHSPSVTHARNAFDRRVAIAVREAKRGAVECSGCGFANAQRAASCVLCGVALVGTTTGKGRRRWWPLARAPQTAASQDGPSIALGGVTTRQRRVRRRRDWVREIDPSGRPVWRNHSGQQPGSAHKFPAYVLQTTTELRHPSAAEAPGDVRTSTVSASFCTDQNEAEIEVVVDGAAPVLTTDHVARVLATELRDTTVTIVDAASADASHVAFSSTLIPVRPATSAVNICDSIHSSRLDFPTKLAQFITSMAGQFATINQSGESVVSRLVVTRESLLPDSMAALATIPASSTRAAFRVEFAGEQGIDAGGVYREWFLLLNEAVIKPGAGIFVCVDEREQTFSLNPHSHLILGDEHLTHLLAAGRLLGRALLEGNVTGFHLALPLLKIVLGLPVGFPDLEYYDPEAYKNLCWLLDNDGVDMLGLNFTVTEKRPDGSTREIELVPGGSQLDVTDANKHEFLDRKLKYLLFDSIHDQLFAFLKGLYQVVPAELLVLFDAEELDYVLSGSDEIDVEDWERNTIASTNLAYYPADELFWKVVRELSPDERRRLLQFATGSTRVPPGGFGALTSNDGQLCLFSLRGVVAKETRGYLHSHACFNRVDLPMHKNLHEMRQAVHAAIAGESVGFTTD